ncbi:hypothetical protein [Microbacterium sp. SA39]|uniref:hypothetical protein n=1 Tax=Microbacterium sp. SA39 TaxID=1263625 RepID=UPI0005FA5D91|nr:hypothetical protein [Microbacterium sp. SA39]KJQ52861.1 hypothetical protein RS85_03755 [Microbacterium sp. SA39]
MYSFTQAEAFSPDGLSAWFSARQEIDAAIGALESAGVALMRLVDDSDWQSDGVRALHEQLRQFQSRAGVELGSLQARESEVEAVGVA